MLSRICLDLALCILRVMHGPTSASPVTASPMKTDSTRANVLIACMFIAGTLILGYAGLHWENQDPARFVCYFALAVLCSGMKVTLPGIEGAMSVVFLFTLLGVVELSLSETLCVIAVATLFQCYWHAATRPRPVQVVFNISSITVAVYVCDWIYHLTLPENFPVSAPLRLIAAGATYFVLNTYPVAAVIAFTGRKSIATIWHQCYFWSFPYYLVGAGRLAYSPMPTPNLAGN